MVAPVRWASCGAAALTGDADGPPLVPYTCAAETVDDALSPFGLDAGVLAERAALLALGRSGSQSCGGASRLLPAADGWVVITLARPDDVAALPAVFEVDTERFEHVGAGGAVPWPVVARLVRDRPAEEVVARGRLLGVPLGRVGERAQPFTILRVDRGSDRSGRVTRPPTVVDLSALWAGPFTAACLQRIGARVVKIEDLRRPDGTRGGSPAFFDLLNGGKLSVALDLGDPARREVLVRLVESADIVVSAARPRALDQLGLDPFRFLAGGTDRVWVAITAYGWDEDRIGFGDDVAATAGLVAWHPDGAPRFASDAIADPLGGARAAGAALDAWSTGGRWFVDASLAGSAAATLLPAERGTPVAERDGEDWRVHGVPVRPPVARSAVAPASALGADTDRVLATLA